MIAYFDCFAGISGDMILGALVDAGLGLDRLRGSLDRLHLPGEFRLETKRAEKHGIAATKVDVVAKVGHVHRHLRHILDILSGSDLDDIVATKAERVFRALAEAEAAVHGTTPEAVHFHEVGSVDAIVDVVGAISGLHLLDVREVHSSALAVGTGVTRSAHGRIPIPVPAVVELCRGLPLRRTGIKRELVTPTGAALITVLAESFGEPITLRTVASGYGAGTRDLDEVPNLLRLELGNTPDIPEGLERDQVVVLEANIDDMSAEAFGYLTEQLLAEGARDAYLTPVHMKKGRPGTQITVLCNEADHQRLGTLLLRESTTLGYRIVRADRVILPRTEATVNTEFGPIRVKRVQIEGRRSQAPEYEDCARIARKRGVPLLDVYRAAERA